ncbi:RNA-binding protein [Alkalilimnicola ehrlichii]|nr:RNA-binding protein [Alkalilimnicola ehrlichii]
MASSFSNRALQLLANAGMLTSVRYRFFRDPFSVSRLPASPFSDFPRTTGLDHAGLSGRLPMHGVSRPAEYALIAQRRIDSTKCRLTFTSLIIYMTSIYVGNLPFTATEEEVRDMFAVHGQVDEVRLMTDRETGRARGFGFVKMAADAAQAAIRSLNGKNLGGRDLRVNEAEERKPSASRW